MTNVTIIGAGQQGTAMAMAFAGAGYNVCAYDNNGKTLAEVQNIVSGRDNITLCGSLTKAVFDADIIVLATPIDKFSVVLEEMGGHVQDNVIITDIGSGKVKAISEVQNSLPAEAIYIPAHILTGRAGSGPASAEEGMYKDQVCIIVPQNASVEAEQQVVEKLWQDIGSRTIHMEADTHDRLYGAISHFQRVISISLMASGEDPLNLGHALDSYKNAGNYMLDMTRTAKSSIPMWLPIFADNKQAILEAAQGFIAHVSELKEMISSEDREGLRDFIVKAHYYRNDIPDSHLRGSLDDELNGYVEKFNYNAAEMLIKSTLIPTVIAAASILNLEGLEAKYFKHINILDVITPAFKDGSAPMLSDPDYITGLLLCDSNALVRDIEQFEHNINTFVAAIDMDYQPYMEERIKSVTSARDDMPHHKAIYQPSEYLLENN